MKDKNFLNKSITIYVVSCCFDDRLEKMEVVFKESEAIELWETFTGKDYNKFLDDLKKGLYNYSKTAGTVL